jgi:hypothetical protein
MSIQGDEGQLVNSEWFYIGVLLIALIGTVSITLIFQKKRRKIPVTEGEKNLREKLTSASHQIMERWPFKIERSVTSNEAAQAKEELKMLELEREILSDTIRKLYEAHAEGKITEEERELLAKRYKSRMMKIKDAITRKESIVALHELETMQEDLMKLFNERFDELSRKIEELRSRVEVKPVKEIAPITIQPVETELKKEATKKEKPKIRKRPRPEPQKTEAERRIEEIRAEVEKVLERLGQMEIEG